MSMKNPNTVQQISGHYISNNFCVVVKDTKIGCSFFQAADVISHTIFFFTTSHERTMPRN
jgi:hypothetical protein